jgi:aryl-alcohol dehydrogenase-like predicted oxidoreductase
VDVYIHTAKERQSWMSNRIAIGTAQFGSDYGVTNTHGQVGVQAIRDILGLAKKRGIDTLDTAIAYGSSENALGMAGVNGWNVVTKLPPVPVQVKNVNKWVFGQIRSSLSRLGVARLHGVLLHRPEDVLSTRGTELIESMYEIRDKGLTQKIGLSIYHPDELGKYTEVMEIGLLQAPLNVLDRRLIESGWLSRLDASGVEVHARSVFLQGLLLASRHDLPSIFRRWDGVWEEWWQWLSVNRLSAVEACLGYCLGHGEVDKVIIGVDSMEQLGQILEVRLDRLPGLPAWSNPIDPTLINPALWSKL